MASRHQKSSNKSDRVKVFVGKIGLNTTPSSLRAYFDQFGTIIVARLEVSKCSGKRKGFGYIIYESLRNANKICSAVHTLDGHSVEVDLFLPEVLTFWHTRRQESIKVEISGVPISTKEAFIFNQLNSAYGPIMLLNMCETNESEFNKSECSYIAEIERNDRSLRSFSSARIKLPANSDDLAKIDFSHLATGLINQENSFEIKEEKKSDGRTTPGMELHTSEKSRKIFFTKSQLAKNLSKKEMLEAVSQRLPYNHQIQNIKLNIHTDEIRQSIFNSLELTGHAMNSLESRYYQAQTQFFRKTLPQTTSPTVTYRHF